MELSQVRWDIKTAHEMDDGWIKKLSHLRGEQFYEQGKRPLFRLANGEFYDQDEFDSVSLHVLAYDNEKLIGSIRLLPVKPPCYHCISSNIVGEENFIPIIQSLFKNKNRLLEINRLAVHHQYHHLNLAVYLCAAVWVLADQLGNLSFANGNKALLDSFHLKHLGGVYFEKHAGPYYSEHYNDPEIYLIAIDKTRMSPYFLRHVQKMAFIDTLYQQKISELCV